MMTGTIAEAARSMRSVGPLGLLVEFDSLEQVSGVHQQLSTNPLPGQVDSLAAATTVMLTFATGGHRQQAAAELDQRQLEPFTAAASSEVDIPVVYDGEDLEIAAEAAEMSIEALINWHSQQTWRGGFVGFAPGFTYCVAEEDPRSFARHASPRTKVPAGAVALGGRFSGVYPRISPGGWQLIGRTRAAMWDINRSNPALVRPGDRVRYVPTSPEQLTVSTAQASQQSTAADTSRSEEVTSPQAHTGADVAATALRVIAPGMQLLIQDTGRLGYSDLGVSRAGAADEAAARQANRLLGNDETAAVLEALNGGARFTAETTTVLSVCGAETPLTITDAHGAIRHPELRTPFVLLAGERLELGIPTAGLRAVIALRGGVVGREELGSLSTDTMSGLGPAQLQPGETISAAAAPAAPVGEPEASTLPAVADDGSITLRFTYGPREDWFTATERGRLASQRWQVTDQADRVGMRLEADPADDEARPLQRLRTDELASEGVARGSLQMPPEGNPVLFLNDHPVTGGYPVIGVVIPADLSAAAQLRPDDTLRLLPVDPATLSPLTPEAYV